MKAKIFSTVSVLALSLSASSARADLSEFQMHIGASSTQTSADSAPVFGGYLTFSYLYEQNIGDYTSATFAYPGQNSQLTSSFNQALGEAPGAGIAASIVGEQIYSSLSAFNAAYPFGVYTATAYNSATLASQSTAIDYTQNQFSVTPALTASSYNQLQGMNPAAPFQVNFVTPFNPNGSESTVQVDWISTTGTAIGSMQASPSSPLIIPANALLPNTTYDFGVVFENEQTSSNAGVPGAIAFDQVTHLTFTTGNAAPVQVVSVPGGSVSHPVQLSGTGIAEIDGSIEGDGSAEFYGFSWAGGAFTVDASVTGANANASYDFILYGPNGEVADVVLDAADSFMAPIDEAAMAAGDYAIGLVANSANDPEFSIVFDTPVSGGGGARVVPEPSTWAMLLIGFAGLGFAGLRVRRHTAIG